MKPYGRKVGKWTDTVSKGYERKKVERDIAETQRTEMTYQDYRAEEYAIEINATLYCHYYKEQCDCFESGD